MFIGDLSNSKVLRQNRINHNELSTARSATNRAIHISMNPSKTVTIPRIPARMFDTKPRRNDIVVPCPIRSIDWKLLAMSNSVNRLFEIFVVSSARHTFSMIMKANKAGAAIPINQTQAILNAKS
jgi:hypothetical protein